MVIIIDMDVVIREMERKDYSPIAAIWRDVLGFFSETEETVA